MTDTPMTLVTIALALDIEGQYVVVPDPDEISEAYRDEFGSCLPLAVYTLQRQFPTPIVQVVTGTLGQPDTVHLKLVPKVSST